MEIKILIQKESLTGTVHYLIVRQLINKILHFASTCMSIYFTMYHLSSSQCFSKVYLKQGWIQDFKLGEGGANFFGVFCVKNHDFMQKKSYFFQIQGGGCTGCAPPGSTPEIYIYTFYQNIQLLNLVIIIKTNDLLSQALVTFADVGYSVYTLWFTCS